MILIQILLYLLLAYAVIGIIFAIWFVLRGVDQVDEIITRSPWTLRLLIFPGSAGLWVVLLKNIWVKRKDPHQAE